MILVFLFLIPWPLASIWWFFRPGSSIYKLERFKRHNRAVFFLAAVGVLVIAYYFWRTTGQSADRTWWPVLAAMASLFWLCILFSLGTSLRYVFRQHDIK